MSEETLDRSTKERALKTVILRLRRMIAVVLYKEGSLNSKGYIYIDGW